MRRAARRHERQPVKPYYSADGITLYQGDNREVLAALGLKPEDVALLWGDPPYGVHLRDRSRRSGRHYGRRLAGDDRPVEVGPWLQYPRIVLWGAEYLANQLPPTTQHPSSGTQNQWWIWHRRPPEQPVERSEAELAWTSLRGPIKVFSHNWNGIYRDSEVGAGTLHPTQKPVALAAWGFRQAKLKPGDLVLSPWLGSGPEAVAARDMGLRFIGIELVTEYLDACVIRLRQAPLPLVAPVPEPEQVGLGLSLDSPSAKR